MDMQIETLPINLALIQEMYTHLDGVYLICVGAASEAQLSVISLDSLSQLLDHNE